jgi:hypothetical protein
MTAVAAKRGDQPVNVSAVRNGPIAVRLTDHPEPAAHSGHSIHLAAARALAEALASQRPVRVPTLEGARMLAFSGTRLAEEGAPGPGWTLDEEGRAALAEALLRAVDA